MSRLDGALFESRRRYAVGLAVVVLATTGLSCSGEGRRDANGVPATPSTDASDRALPKDPDPRWYGYSVGHWEDDDTFVVNTVGTDERSWVDNAGNPHSRDLKVEERYHRVNRTLMELTVTLDDPKAYTRPWTPRNKMPLTLAPANLDMMEMICSPTEVMDFRKNISDRTNNK